MASGKGQVTKETIQNVEEWKESATHYSTRASEGIIR